MIQLLRGKFSGKLYGKQGSKFCCWVEGCEEGAEERSGGGGGGRDHRHHARHLPKEKLNDKRCICIYTCIYINVYI